MKDLSILCQVHWQETNPHATPSWVPDWSRTEGPFPLNYTLATGMSLFVADFLTSLTVHEVGRSIGTIAKVTPFLMFQGQDTREIASALRSAVLQLDLGFVNVQKISMIGRVLCRNRFSYRRVPAATGVADISKAMSCFTRIFEDDPSTWRDLDQLVINDVFTACYPRSIFTTECGKTGLAPLGSHNGDKVAILLGCETAIILRSSNDTLAGMKEYTVIGGAYCDGFMSGEALLGTLPDEVEHLLKWNGEGKCYYTGFGNPMTETIAYEDPRLIDVPLPAGWLKTERQGDYPLFTNSKTGKETKWDPRLTAEVLRERGVELEDYLLV